MAATRQMGAQIHIGIFWLFPFDLPVGNAFGSKLLGTIGYLRCDGILPAKERCVLQLVV